MSNSNEENFCNICINIINSLIRFCVGKDLTGDEKELKSNLKNVQLELINEERQNILREFGLIENLTDIVHFPFHNKIFDLKQLKLMPKCV